MDAHFHLLLYTFEYYLIFVVSIGYFEIKMITFHVYDILTFVKSSLTIFSKFLTLLCLMLSPYEYEGI